MAVSNHSGALPAVHSSDVDAAFNDMDLFTVLIGLPRRNLETLIEAAIAHLDATDGDPDMEPSEGDLEHLDDDDALPRHRFGFTLVGRMQ